MNPFLFKEIAEVATHTGSEIPGFKIDLTKGETSVSELKRPFSSLEHSIPTFKNPELGELKSLDSAKIDGKTSLTGKETEAFNDIHEDVDEKSDVKPLLPEKDGQNDVSKAETEEVNRRIPKAEGTWTGEPGNSTWVPDKDYVPKVYNPEGKTWEEILADHDIDGIDFKDGEPDFSEVSEGTVEIDDFSDSRAKNFALADEKLAEQWNKEGKDGRTDWTSDDVDAYREDNDMTWHEHV